MYRKYIWMQIRKIGTVPEMPPCNYDYTPPPYKGTSYETLKSAYATRLLPTVKQFYAEPLLLTKGLGQWLWDYKGRRYLDMLGGIVTISVGHCHPKIVDAMARQASQLNHISSVYMHPHLYEYVEKLTAKLPEKFTVVYMTNSGAEANELAYLMARCYTKQYNIISFRNSYHGGTFTSSASTAMSAWKFPMNHTPGHIHAMNPDVYRGPWGCAKCRDSSVQLKTQGCECGEGECVASRNYLEQFKDVFRYSLPNQGCLAGFVAESIQGIGGVVQYPKSFLKNAYEVVRQHGGVCIADEVQTGFARTGEHFWGFEGHGVIPDIITMAKGIANGFPVGAVATTAEIASSLEEALYFNTFATSPVACAVASAVLDIIDEEKLQENSHVVGCHLLSRLSEFMTEFPEIVGDVRGKGLMIGVELVSNKETKEAMKNQDVLEIFESIKDMGVLVGRGGVDTNVLRIKPPLCVRKEDADFAVEVIRIALQKWQSKRS